MLRIPPPPATSTSRRTPTPTPTPKTGLTGSSSLSRTSSLPSTMRAHISSSGVRDTADVEVGGSTKSKLDCTLHQGRGQDEENYYIPGLHLLECHRKNCHHA
ncbi:hypothetical protein EX30DRAFT_398349 [Ascodesmis nigricans]|uniref:Uncharacterized protein n=1 Tax=Ascodesmis nigricans TaxID=341454 RepID=A0A4S2MKV5_9PEZI|nr:hypothetical protein EX30DRAFT_398349 [Ascodesmis nigricans]